MIAENWNVRLRFRRAVMADSSGAMNKLLFAFVTIIFVSTALNAPPPKIDPSHIDAYVTPYYDSKGPTINVGRFSSGLASEKEPDLLTTIFEMKKDWDHLTFPELYVGAIRLYDLGYRKEAVTGFIPLSIKGGNLEFC